MERDNPSLWCLPELSFSRVTIRADSSSSMAENSSIETAIWNRTELTEPYDSELTKLNFLNPVFNDFFIGPTKLEQNYQDTS